MSHFDRMHETRGLVTLYLQCLNEDCDEYEHTQRIEVYATNGSVDADDCVCWACGEPLSE